MVLPTSGSISISDINSCARFTNGNMGINTTSPNYNLDINGTLKATTITTSNLKVSSNSVFGSNNTTIDQSGNITTYDDAYYNSYKVSTSQYQYSQIGSSNYPLYQSLANSVSDGYALFGLDGTAGETGGCLGIQSGAFFINTLTTTDVLVGTNNVLKMRIRNSGIVDITTGLSTGNIINTNSTITNLQSTTITAGNILATTSISSGALHATNSTITNAVRTNVSSGTLNLSTGLTAGTILATTSISSGAVNATNSTVTNFVATSNTVGTSIITTSLLAIGNSNTVGNIFTTGGNVGINTTTPSAHLHVAGGYSNSINSTTGSLRLEPGWIGHAGIVSFFQANGTRKGFIGYGLDNTSFELHGEGSRQITLFTNDIERMTVSSTGNVGIGTNTPSYKLSVSGAGGFTGNLYVNHGAAGNTPQINVSPSANTSESSIGFWQNTNNGGAVWVIGHNPSGVGNNNFGIYSSTYGGNALSILNNGNVGINTNSPTEKLNVVGNIDLFGTVRIGANSSSSAFQINLGTTGVGSYRSALLYGDGTNILFSNQQNGNINFGTNNFADRLVIAANGNVGVGTASPTAKLNVSGTTDLFGPLRVGGNSSSSEFIINLGTTGVGGDRAGYLYGSGTHIELFNQQNGHIVFGTNNTNRVQIGANGRLTVGGLNGSYPLTVFGSSNSGSIAGYAGWSGNYVWQNQTSSYDVSIYSQNFMMSGQGFVTVSDQRIKKDIIEIEDGESLSILRQIQPKRYRYIDEYKRGTDYVYGFIAQQVRGVLPAASGLVKDFIPSIMTSATVSYDSANDITTVTLVDNKQHNLTSENSNSRVRFFDENDQNTDLELHEIVSGNIFKVKGELKGTNTFAYGLEVEDFHTLNKDAIFTVALAALQEVDRELQETKQTVNDLVQRIQALENANV